MIENIVRRAKKLSIKRTIDGGEQGHLHPGPARLDPAGVPRARGPAEHDEPRRLGEDLGQEGRAHRLRAHDRRRGRRATRVAVRSSASPPVSTCSRRSSRIDVGHARAGRLTPWPSRRCAGSRPSTASCCAARADPNPVLASSMLINGYVEHHRVGWDFEDESPGPRRARLRPRRRAAARDRDAPRQHRAHQRRALLRRPRAPRVLHARVRRRAASWCCADKAGERILARSMHAARRLLGRRARRSSSTRTTPTARATRTARHENYLVDRAVPFATLVRNLLPWFVSRQVFTGAGKVGTENGADAGRLPDQPARRLLRGGGRARDHAEAPDRQHARRAARRSAEVPAPARDRRRREPLRGRDVPQGRHDRDRARDDRRRLHRQGPLDHRPGRRDAHGVARPDVPRDGRAARRRALHRGRAAVGVPAAGAEVRRRDRPRGVRWRGRRRRRCSTAGKRCSARSSATRWRSTASSTGSRSWSLLRAYVDRDGLEWDDPKLSLLDLQYHDVRPDRSLYERLVRAGKVERLVDEADVHRGDDGAARDDPGLLPRRVPRPLARRRGRGQLGQPDPRRRRGPVAADPDDGAARGKQGARRAVVRRGVDAPPSWSSG